jgi:hypothetical protein
VREFWPSFEWQFERFNDADLPGDAPRAIDYATAVLPGIPLVSGLAQPFNNPMRLRVNISTLEDGQELVAVWLLGTSDAIIAESYVEPGDYREAIEGGRAALLAWVQAVAVAVQGALGGAS